RSVVMLGALLGVLVVAVGDGVTWALWALAGWGLLGIAVILIGGGMIVANRWRPRRTGLGTDLFRKTLGFRLYMPRAEKDRQAFAEEAEIFTQYLPYAIVFGCVHRWAKAFEGIDTSAAVSSWYQGAGPFYPAIFASSLEGFSSTLSTTIAQTPAGSGGSGGGGGGFSGGAGGCDGGGSRAAGRTGHRRDRAQRGPEVVVCGGGSLSATAGGAGIQGPVLKPDRDRGYAAVRAPLLQRPGPRLQHRDRDLSRAVPGAADGIHALPVLRDGGAGGSRAAQGHVQLAAGEPIGHIQIGRAS